MLLQSKATLPRATTLRSQALAGRATRSLAALGVLLTGSLVGCMGQIEEAAEFRPGSAQLAGEGAAEPNRAGSLDSANATDSVSSADPADAIDLVESLNFAESGIGVESVLASIAEQRYREGFPWVKVNEAPFPSAVASAMIDVWVSGAGAHAYASVAPELRVRGEEVPPGTLVVREVWNDAGEVSKLTLMLKGPPGYNPELGDFWFGETDPSGTPLQDEAGAPRLGKLDGCYGCHVPRAEQGYLFGAPAGNRMPYLEAE